MNIKVNDINIYRVNKIYRFNIDNFLGFHRIIELGCLETKLQNF